MVEVIKVIDLTHVPLHMKEIYAKVKGLDNEGKEEVFRIAQVFNVNNGNVKVADIGEDSVLWNVR